MNMDVLVNAALSRRFHKQAAGPLALLPLAGKAVGALGGAAKAIGGSAANMLGTAVAMEGVNRAANKVLGPQGGPPQGGQGPGGTGAGLEPGVGGPRGGATHGMLGFPKQKDKPEGPKGGYGPPNFGNTHSRDRADPDFQNEGANARNPVAGFKLANDVLFEMGLIKRALDTPGAHLADAAANWGDARELGLGALQTGGAAAMDLGRAGAAKARDLGAAGLAKGKELGSAGLAKAKSLGATGLDKAKGLGQAGMGYVRANPGRSAGLAAGGLALGTGAYLLGKKLFGGGGQPSVPPDEPKLAAMLMPSNMLDILAINMEMAEKKANLKLARG